jgi:hypothetical protein
MEMNESEIMKALECCVKIDCEKCNLKTRFKTATNCRNDLLANAIALINRKNAEIEKVRTELDRLTIYFDEAVEAKLAEKALMEGGK